MVGTCARDRLNMVYTNVTLRSGVAKQTIFLFALGRNQTKARARGLDATGSGQGNTDQRGVGKRNPEKAVGEGWRRESGVDNGQQKEAVREGQSGWVGIPSSFVDISLEIHASVSLQMHRECNVMEPPFLHFELIEALIVLLFFFFHSLGCILVTIKKCVIPRSEPPDESPAQTESF